MKAYLIDPVAKTITEVEHEDNYKHIYTLLSGPNAAGAEVAVDLFTVVNIEGDDAIFIDDEGLLKADQAFFKFADFHQPLAGRGLVLGTNDEGDSTSPKCTIDWLRERISWMTAEEAGPPNPGFTIVSWS